MFLIEIAFLSAILILQIVSVGDILARIAVLKSIFSEKPDLDPTHKQFTYGGKNPVKKTIIKTINEYIRKNEGGVVDFHIINDIVERNVDTIDEEVSNKLPTPLYLGLAGTMIGIIVGLFFIDLTPSDPTGSTASTDLFIGPLIDGVKYAMSVSVLGLIFTTGLSVWFYKNAKSAVNEGKNDFLSLIQTELLPSLIKSHDATIQELSKELRIFSKATPQYVSSLAGNTQVVKETIEKEIALLNQIKALDINKLSQSNLRIFDSLSAMMDSFQAFPEYYQELNRSLGNTIELNHNLHSLVSSTENVNHILAEVRSLIETGNSATSFFNEHIKSFQNYSAAVGMSISEVNQSFDKSLGQLKQAVATQMEAFSVAVSEYDSKLSKSFDKAIEKYNAAFADASPDFRNLAHLKKLDGLEESNALLVEIKNLLLNQGEVLKDLNMQPHSREPIRLTQKRAPYLYIRDGIIITFCLIICVVTIYLAVKLT